MARIADLPADQHSPEQVRIAREIAGARGGVVRGPFAIWLRLPALADKANQFGNVLRLEGTLDKRLFELSVLVVARAWKAQYEWFAHESAALAAGVPQDAVEAIRRGQPPAGLSEEEQAAYQVAHELTHQKSLADATYQSALARLGQEPLIELITAIGFYTMVAVVLNGFDAPVPGGVVPIPE